ncbi:MAG: VanZ family protein [Candidatus Binatia bacterium]
MRRARRVLAPVAWMALLWVLSSIPTAPDQTMAGVFIPKVLQKTMHVVVYAVLAATWLWVFDSGRFARTAAMWTVCLASAYAAIDEFHQTFVPGRTGSPWDVGLDTFGAALGIFAIAAVRGAVTPTTAAAASRG